MNFAGQELLLGAAGGLTLIATLAATLSLVWRRSLDRTSRIGQLGDAVAAGIFLGVGLLHMLPEATQSLGNAGGHPVWVFLVTGISLLLLTALNRIGGRGSAGLQALIVTGVMVFHMFLTGFALGAEDSAVMIVALFVALAIHKAAEAFAFGRLIARSGMPTWLGGLIVLLFVVALPFGVFAAVTAATSLPSAQTTASLIMAVGAGTFLHFGLNHTHLLSANLSWQSLLARFIGFALMALLALSTAH